MDRLLRILFLLLPLTCGCTLFNINVIPPVKPLEEKVLEGEGKPKLLLLDISGFISEKEGKGGGLSSAKPSSVSQMREALQKAEKDADLAGVILRINSPGGTVTASDIVYHDILRFKERKKVPVYACITGVGASGGYYVAAAADRIIIHPNAITGSIGVLFLKFNVEGLLVKLGVTEHTMKSADKKDLSSPFRQSTPEEQRIMQEIIDSLANRFKEVVLARSNNRLDRKELEKLADGRVYTAGQALEAKLVDRVGYLEDAIDELKKAVGLKEARVVRYYRPGSYKGSIYSGSPTDAFQEINLININGEGLEMLSEPQFLYLWR